jgi:outer membrane protein assembly factor BamB
VTWKLAMPERSGSTPIVWGDYVFLNVGEGSNLSLWAVDRTSGAVRWKRPLSGGNRRMMKQQMSSPSPVTDGRSVWVMTGTGVLKAFDFSGKELWGRDIQADYGRFGLQWGYASSPLLFEDSLYVQVLHGMHTDDPSYLLRIDKATGKTVWRVLRMTRARFESPDAYTTPALLKQGNSTEIVITGGDVVTGHDPATGQELWRADGLNPSNDGSYRIVASPVVYGDLLFAPSRERPLLALKPGGRGDVTKSHVLWSFNNGPDVPTPVSDGTYLYSINDRGILYCLDARTGKVIYGPQRLRNATYSGSAVLADGRIYITDEDGVTTVIRSGPKFELLSQNDLQDYTLSSPAISDGQIFVRTASFIYAIGRRQAAARSTQ